MIVQENHYYPFGLNLAGIGKEGTPDHKFQFQGQEVQEEFDLNWISFKWRNHDPTIGRFFNIDPLSEKFYYNSPYAFSENKVVAHVELEGLESLSIKEFKQGMKEAKQDIGETFSFQGLKNVKEGFKEAGNFLEESATELGNSIQDLAESALSDIQSGIIIEGVGGDGIELPQAGEGAQTISIDDVLGFGVDAGATKTGLESANDVKVPFMGDEGTKGIEERKISTPAEQQDTRVNQGIEIEIIVDLRDVFKQNEK